MIASSPIGRLLLNMPSDLEIMGRIYWQMREILGDNFMFLGFQQGEMKERFTNVVLDTMLKLHAMRFHMQNFKALEEEFLKSIEATDGAICRSHYMLFEFEAFLFQLKSSLDIAVKALGVLIPNRFKVQTFHNKGDALCYGLEKYKHDKSAKAELADDLISLIKSDRDSWLKHAISLCDDIGHYKTLADFNYHAVNHGEIRRIKMPQISGMAPMDYMELTYQNCIEFIQDFLCLSVALALPRNFGLSSANPSVGEPLAQYIKFGLGARPEA